MKIGPKYKICKRLGASVFEKCQTQKFQLAEARAPRVAKRGGRGGGSDFGPQLIEKQRARFTYGISEKQFSRYAKESMESHGESASMLLARLEGRLDNAVYRAGFSPTRRGARQLVSHGHITVNGRRMNVPSHAPAVGDTLAVRVESRTSPLFGGWAEKRVERRTPAWLTLSDDGFSATVAAVPGAAPSDVAFDPGVIIQFYSR